MHSEVRCAFELVIHSFIHSDTQYRSNLKKKSDIMWILLSFRAWLHVVDYTEIVDPIVMLCGICIACVMFPKCVLSNDMCAFLQVLRILSKLFAEYSVACDVCYVFFSVHCETVARHNNYLIISRPSVLLLIIYFQNISYFRLNTSS